MKSEVPVFQVEGLGFMGEVWAGGRHRESSADKRPKGTAALRGQGDEGVRQR